VRSGLLARAGLLARLLCGARRRCWASSAGSSSRLQEALEQPFDVHPGAACGGREASPGAHTELVPEPDLEMVGVPVGTVVKRRRGLRRASVCGTGPASANSLTCRGVDTERKARVPRALSCSAESVRLGSFRNAWRTLLLMREGEQSAEAGGEDGRQYSCNTGGRRRDGLRPAASDVVLQMGRHCGCYAVARTGPDPGAAALAVRAFWKSLCCARAISRPETCQCFSWKGLRPGPAGCERGLSHY